MVVKYFFDGEVPLRPLNQHEFEQVDQAVKLLHSRGLVLGDLREANLLIENGTGDVKVVDFGWCGTEGEVYYPAL